jgi:hypothetical protein
MESFFATIEDGKIIAVNRSLEGKKKAIITLIEEKDLEEAVNDGLPLHGISLLAASGGAFDFLFQEGEHEYTVDDLKVRYK